MLYLVKRAQSPLRLALKSIDPLLKPFAPCQTCARHLWDKIGNMTEVT